MLKQIGFAAAVLSLIATSPVAVHARGGARSNGGFAKTVHVHGYYRQNGTYVESYDRTAPGTGSHRSSSHSRTATSTQSESSDTTTATTPSKTLTTSSTLTRTLSSPTTNSQTATTPTNASTTPTQSITQSAVTTTGPLVTPSYTVPLDSNAAAQKTYGPLLHNAKQLITAGIYPAAANYLQRIISGAPGTRIAAEAQRLLSTLPI
jgi:hypothetical protein